VRAGQGPRFEPEDVVATPGALELLRRYGKTPFEYLDRHLSGDWGDLEAFDKRENERALKAGARLFSAYAVSPLDTLWIIIEADRAPTCLLLPEDY
jgi:hypothetical protein